MGRHEEQLNLISQHEAAAAEAGKELDEQLKVVHRDINTVAVNEFERSLQGTESLSQYATGSSPEAIQAAIDTARSKLLDDVEEAVQIKIRAIAAEHAGAMATHDLLGLKEISD